METFPAAQTELRKVLQEAFPTSEPLMEEILGTNIPYLDAACEESFRLGGVAKTNLRSTLVDTHILGYPVPKGADIMLNFHLDRTPIPIAESVRSAASHAAAEKRGDWLHQKAGRDLGVFEPRRWLVKDEQTGAETFDAQALPMLAFGGGFRGCPGKKLAPRKTSFSLSTLHQKLTMRGSNHQVASSQRWSSAWRLSCSS